ncbi:MAG: tRNA 2-thiouridine(34) synthase MnmA [Agathobaculum sp.]|uniref:tRNA 2-thiouridine(34) synthase MnmA n=1 Tax=Agathobaculum sp. TaxID=2048138 RepID=UPI0025C6B9D8|nr:tRNA 2-thiouridine(34) synthase MnmA [Agathobaculum sp.]MCI7125290.1 tRNA 2-thiouridine(34) synthase MnmA [Agathobaculum sp.]MDY3712116.1 tRNA 2-thiouridine(34) synthase MnmA [Agathobaculum sp.]
MQENNTALIAMSGGVDSSVAAYLTQRAGYTCAGVTMRLYRNEDIGLCQYRTCCSQRDIDDAAEVAFELDMPFHVADYTAAFKTQVIEKFVRVYENGGTPNPCIDCNRYMKFSHLLDFAAQKGYHYVVTGHYARIAYDEKTGRWLLKKAKDQQKDQSYVLYMLSQEQLARIMFPLGELTKPEVRDIAAQQGFVNARKHDSQDICFVPDGDYVAFMERFTGKQYAAGDYLDLSGKVVGRHRGAVCYTLGQRKGLRLALGEPVYVCQKSMADNTVTVGPESTLYTRSLIADDLNWIPFDKPAGPMRLTACTRHHQKEQAVTAALLSDGRLRLDFDVPQRAVTPGQAVVLYDGELVVGGGTIQESF